MAYQGRKRSGKRAPDPGQAQRAREQQAVLNQLRQGGVLSNPIPANPLARIGAFFTAPSGTKIPALQRARLNGEEVLVNKGGFNLNVAGLGEINVGGQQFFPGKSGNDLIYRRGVDENKKRAVGGQYGSLFSKDQLSRPDIVPPAPGDPRSRATRPWTLAQSL